MSDPLSGLLGSGESRRQMPPPRRPLPPQRRRSLGFGRLFIAIIVMAGLVAGVIFGGKAIISDITHKTTVDDYSGSGTGSVDFTIVGGQSPDTIASNLAALHVVKSAAAFEKAANADSDRAGKIQPGNYIMRLHMSGASAFNRLFDPKAVNANRFTIAEGLDLRHILPIIARATGLPMGDLNAAALSPQLLGLPSWASGVHTAEGFLFPATYAPKKGTSAVAILRSMVARFNTEATALNLVAGAQARGVKPLDIVTLASIVEREVNQTADLRKAAAVMYNRLKDTADFPTLGMDSTTRYALGDVTGPLTQSQLADPSPYNTRVSPGIPPGPIGNPGEATLKAVLAPVVGDYTYFVYLPKEKKTVFTASSSEFNQLQLQYQQECTASPGSC
ncbi:MAG TPA: endolytic transglycosylase MltG [Frankiaceae bacterium]|jgi:UPF0755 protein|nr:endolytic transglycosylase MltG [Frankiaceae bacterium]